MATTTPNQNTWADIPPEIVEQILRYCDRRSLLALSQLNHQLNSSALSRYFAPQITRALIRLPSVFTPETPFPSHARGAPPMRILRTALWLPRTIQHIDYYLPPHVNCDDFFNDLVDLTVFISRMPKLISLRIDSNFAVGGRVDKQSRHDIWKKLFVTAISKGCRILEVMELGAIRYERSSPVLSGDLNALDLQPEPQLCCFFRPPSLPNPTIASQGRCSFLSPGHSFPRMKSPLQEVHMDGVTLKSSPLMFHTILTRHAASIIQLSLRNLLVWEATELKKIFDRLHFPALKSFTFSNRRLVSPITFLKFLSHHRTTLTLLDLEADFRQSPDQLWPVPKWSFWRHPPAFPNLQELRTFPGNLAWLVPDFRRCPNLCSIVFQGNELTHKSRSAIKSILNNLHAFPSMTGPLAVEIGVPLGDLSGLLELRTVMDGETQARWPRVKELKLINTSSPHLEIDALVNWLSTFPSLEYLEVEDTLPHIFREKFVETVVARCPKFRSFRHPHYTLHSSLGREWKVWDVQDGRVSSRTTFDS